MNGAVVQSGGLAGVATRLHVDFWRDLHRFRNREHYDHVRTTDRLQRNGDHTALHSYAGFDRHQAIFVHIPKTAGLSIAHALFGHAVGHANVSAHRKVFGRSFWRYFKFCFVRNPYDRLVSSYEYLASGGHPASKNDERFRNEVLSPYRTFDEFVLEWLRAENLSARPHFVPQSTYVTLDAQLVVDFVGRFERLEEDFASIREQLGMGSDLGHRNALNGSGRRDVASYFADDRVKERVIDVYASDFELFGYDVAVPVDPRTAQSVG